MLENNNDDMLYASIQSTIVINNFEPSDQKNQVKLQDPLDVKKEGYESVKDSLFDDDIDELESDKPVKTLMLGVIYRFAPY